MLLCVDVGNTNTVLGVFHEERLLAHWRLETSERRTGDEWGILLLQLFAFSGLETKAVKGIAVSSVVPAVQHGLERMGQRYFSQKLFFVGPGIKTGMPVLYDNPREVGADRIVNAVAAFEKKKRALVVVDFGTATTFDVVSARGEYLGGAICPGIEISMQALFQRAAKLPRIEFVQPPFCLGKNTIHSMQAGLVFGFAAMVDGICERIAKERGETLFVMATGGLAMVLARESRCIEEVDAFLTLEGLRILFERNRE
ncbi:MAG: type III pantothenate kinase [Proteobacteria bacterium]|nr:type III pantothenate kinase [Cystobacterineae bacterium]MCL2259482.1 type III pantothenate kinase [Cystobacterineae bacterium]MCL2315317.1 type III pantothenate kinase [Pseudomonadota bacterium]